MKPLKDINDAELAHRIKYGDKEAYKELFERYAPRIFHFSLSYLKNNADAEELVQDVFMKVWEKMTELKKSGKVKYIGTSNQTQKTMELMIRDTNEYN